MAIALSRRIAFDVLTRVAAEGAYASELLYSCMGPRVGRADAALATELTLGVLRWQRLLDFLLDRCLQPNNRPAAEHLDLEVLLALRLALYQLRFLDRVPAHAAVSESVELVKTSRKRSAASLVNAVLRRAAQNAKATEAQLADLLPPDLTPAHRAAILYSHPAWMAERWFHSFGAQRATELLKANNRPALLSCAVLDASRASAIAEAITATGVKVTPGRWLKSALAIHGGNPASIEAYRAGEISFQDEASQMVAHLVGALPGNRVLDVCAAPGGKTTLLARAVAPGGSVVAADLHLHRLRGMGDLLARTGTRNVSLLAIDAGSPLPFSEKFRPHSRRRPVLRHRHAGAQSRNSLAAASAGARGGERRPNGHAASGAARFGSRR